MARPSKKGLDYFPRDTDYYDDFKIVDLMYEYGTLGQTVFDVVLTFIYKNGYYVEIPLEKMVQLVIRTIGNKWAEKDAVTAIIRYCGEIGLLDKGLLAQNVFTSVGIQRRYNEITARNKVDKALYWLLDGFCTDSGVSDAETGVYVAETQASVAETPINKIKENKIKEECCYGARAHEDNDEDADDSEDDHLCIVDKKYSVVMLTERQMNDLLERLSLDEFNAYIEKLGAYIVKHNAHIKSHYETILKWVAEDRQKMGG